MSTPLRTVLLLLALAPALPGCASLYAQPGDSGALRVAKATTRVALGIPTLGISEAVIGLNARHRARLAHVRDLTARYEDAVRAVETAGSEAEWREAMLRYEWAAEEVDAYRADLRAASRTQLAVEPFASIHAVRRHLDERALPTEPRPTSAMVEFPRVTPRAQPPRW